jgi:hypothetical protein
MRNLVDEVTIVRKKYESFAFHVQAATWDQSGIGDINEVYDRGFCITIGYG